MTGDENPYRFVDVSAEEQELEGLEWDLRDYVEPPNEPVFGPDEIVLIAKRWNGFAMSAIVLQGVAFVLGLLLLPSVQMGSPRDGSPPFAIYTYMEPGWVAVTLAFGLLAQSPIAVGIYLLARSLRYPASRSLTFGAVGLVPAANFAALVVLGYQAIKTLRRHGIRAGFFGAADDSLPCAAE